MILVYNVKLLFCFYCLFILLIFRHIKFHLLYCKPVNIVHPSRVMQVNNWVVQSRYFAFTLFSDY